MRTFNAEARSKENFLNDLQKLKDSFSEQRHIARKEKNEEDIISTEAKIATIDQVRSIFNKHFPILNQEVQ
ncbi:hypothetical protein [Roseivirga spongicola]|uniref:Uncharacterized protein n=1 Tax=Roseivirga spongicola TaxID=333140 RepID=A0A150XCF7_9BACT|nr:hypothetical protein [Roseivirga spongicola]KYG76419.1 hypothetical protein AWW68_19425 [Roseivirga spongicola]WPZ08738.1 hypothetical protein T7867_10760 [Roseivirga spongicola]